MSAPRLSPVMLRALWAYRGFVFGAVRRDLESRYRGSLFGAIWVVVNPLAQILVFTLVFAELMKPTLPGHEGSVFAYGVYLCAGVVAWTLFADILQRMTTVFVDNANLIKKASFPRIALPAIVILTGLVNFAVIFAVLLVFLAATGEFPGAVLLHLVPVVAVEVAFVAGLGLLLGTLHVFFRDVGQFVGVALTFWFWLTPIVYVSQTLPPRAQQLIALNPLTPMVEAFHRVLLDRVAPAWGGLTVIALVALLLFVLSGVFFLRQAPELVDEL